MGHSGGMCVCVVGNGPSAKGRSDEIDACDFVVRTKAWWAYGADDAGSRCNALAWYGAWEGFCELKESLSCEHWFTQTVQQVKQKGDKVAWERLLFFAKHAGLSPIRWATEALWQRSVDYLNRHPSTGFMAVAMVMDILQSRTLCLYGFDSTLPELPNFADARKPLDPDEQFAHDVLAEKRAIAEIRNGTWLGKPTVATLTWPDMPELQCGDA